MSVIENEKKYLEIILKHEANGVEFLTSHGIVIEEDVKIGRGTQILPGTILKGNTVIGENCVIGPNSMLTDCTIGDGVVFNASQGAESVVEDGAKIGPFTQLRPNSHICKKVKIGDFVEVKNSTVGEGTSIAHLTYIGDSDVDIATAKNSHLDAIGVSWGFRGRKFLEDLNVKQIVDRPIEILNYIEK